VSPGDSLTCADETAGPGVARGLSVLAPCFARKICRLRWRSNERNSNACTITDAGRTSAASPSTGNARQACLVAIAATGPLPWPLTGVCEHASWSAPGRPPAVETGVRKQRRRAPSVDAALQTHSVGVVFRKEVTPSGLHY
jgi:hypothetical protein